MSDDVLPGPGHQGPDEWRPSKFDGWVEQWLAENGQGLPFPPRTDAELEVLLERLRMEPSVPPELAERLIARLAVERDLGPLSSMLDRLPEPRVPDGLGERVIKVVRHELELEGLLGQVEQPEIPVGLSARVLSGVRQRLEDAPDGRAAELRLDELLGEVPAPEIPVGIAGRVMAGLNAERGILDAAEESRAGRILPFKLLAAGAAAAAAIFVSLQLFGGGGVEEEDQQVAELSETELESTLDLIEATWDDLNHPDFAMGQLSELDVWLLQHSKETEDR